MYWYNVCILCLPVVLVEFNAKLLEVQNKMSGKESNASGNEMSENSEAEVSEVLIMIRGINGWRYFR